MTNVYINRVSYGSLIRLPVGTYYNKMCWNAPLLRATLGPHTGQLLGTG